MFHVLSLFVAKVPEDEIFTA